jgi:transposase
MKFLRENGMSIKQIAKEVGVGVGTVYSVVE